MGHAAFEAVGGGGGQAQNDIEALLVELAAAVALEGSLLGNDVAANDFLLAIHANGPLGGSGHGRLEFQGRSADAIPLGGCAGHGGSYGSE